MSKPTDEKRLYCVEVELEMYVVAASEEDARDVARSHMREEISMNDSAAFWPGEIEADEALTEDDRDCLPWGGGKDDRRTVGEWLVELKRRARDVATAAEVEKRQVKLPLETI